MRRLAQLVTVVVSLFSVSCFDFQPDPPESPSALEIGRYADVRVEYRQPQACANDAARCEDLVVFFGSWMKPGEEIYLQDNPASRYQWSGIARHVPVNWPPTDSPHLVRVFDPHLVDTANAGITAARLSLGGQTIYFFESPGTAEEAGLIYIDDVGVGRNPQ